MSLYVDDIFEQVSGMPADRWDGELARRCAGHPSLEAEVRALLHAMEDGAPARPPPGAIEPGVRLGRYRLEERLGDGATASVWKAWDTHLQTWTALKLLHPNGPMRGHKALDAVMHEARAASGILSDHVVRIATAGKFDGNLHFIEMELCAEHRAGPDGTELLEVGRTLNETELSGFDEIVRVVAEAARGVDAAHRLGVLHRDLKPSNILLTPVSHRAKVTDFGLAAPQLFPAPTAATSPTATVTVMVEAHDGKLVGTPAYMAPEQAFGQPPTRRSDVYGLGATLWAMLAARPPYEASGTHNIPALDVVEQVRAGPPDELRAVVPAVPRRLARIVAKAMARSPRDRYRTAADFAADLEAYRAVRTTTIDGRNPVLPFGLALRRNRELAASAAVLVLILVISVGTLGWLDVRKRALEVSIAEAVAHRLRARVESDAADRVRELAEQQRDLALQQAEDARQARDAAKRSEAGAEERSAIASRRARQAEEARDLAEEARDAAELARVAADEGLLEATSRLEQTAAELEAAMTRVAGAEQDLADSEVRRALAEDALADARMVVGEREAQLSRLAEALESERAARAASDEELQRLSDALAGARQALDAIQASQAPVDAPPSAELIP